MTSRTDLSPAFRPPGVAKQDGASSVGPVTPQVPTPATPSAPQLPDLPTDVLISKALSGSLTPGEAQALSTLLDSPQANDRFTPEQRADLQAFTQGRDLPPRAPDELHSDLKLLKDAREVPNRFSADFVFAKEQLLEHASLLRADKAQRMFDFMVPYVQAAVQLAATPAQQAQVAAQLVKHAEKAGYSALQSGDGANALKVLQDLLKAKTPEEVRKLVQGLKFDAPIWPKDPARQTDPHHLADREHLAAVNAGAAKVAGEPQLLKPLPQVMVPPVPVQQQRVEDPQASRESHNGTNRRLGTQMLWNILHRFRDSGEDDQDSAAQREAMTQLAVAAGLILVFIAIVVGVMVAL